VDRGDALATVRLGRKRIGKLAQTVGGNVDADNFSVIGVAGEAVNSDSTALATGGTGVIESPRHVADLLGVAALNREPCAGCSQGPIATAALGFGVAERQIAVTVAADEAGLSEPTDNGSHPPRKTTTEREQTTRLAMLARSFQLQDAIAVLELDRVLDAAPDELDGHRLGLKAARQDRLNHISRSTA